MLATTLSAKVVDIARSESSSVGASKTSWMWWRDHSVKEHSGTGGDKVWVSIVDESKDRRVE